MNDDDRKFLTEWGGECWHEIPDNAFPGWICPKCGITLTAIHYSGWNPKAFHRTFDGWKDFGWLWDLMRNRTIKTRFMTWILGFSSEFPNGSPIDYCTWEDMTPADRCQLICDFLREQEAEDE